MKIEKTNFDGALCFAVVLAVFALSGCSYQWSSSADPGAPQAGPLQAGSAFNAESDHPTQSDSGSAVSGQHKGFHYQVRSREQLSHDLNLRLDVRTKPFGASHQRSFEFKETNDEKWERIQWLDKALQVMRGYGLLASDPFEELLALPREELVDSYLARPEIAESIYHFNRFWFGMYGGESLRDAQGQFSMAEFSNLFKGGPTLLKSATEAAAGREYIKALFADSPNRYIFPLSSPSDSAPQPGDTPAIQRWRAIAKFRQESLLEWKAMAEHRPPLPKEEYCAMLSGDFFSKWFEFGYKAGLPSDVANTGVYTAFNIVYSECGPDLPKMTFDRSGAWRRFVSGFDQIMHEWDEFEPEVYKISSLFDIMYMDYLSRWPQLKYIAWSNEFLEAKLINSSTNFNRKRAAYFLKRFFCEDLTPIGVETPDHASGGQHGSDPSCYACHYKLDPMAGFFKDIVGFGFYASQSNPFIYFSDGATALKADYEKNWLAADGAAHKFNIGYIRAVNRPELNTYGENFGDLLNILAEAPEVRSCLTERALQFVLGENQSYDRGYQEQLSSKFSQDSTNENSGYALKQLLKSIVLSKGFAQVDTQPGVCYDYPDGYDPTDRPPCAVAAILEKNCATCHKSVESMGHLDLRHWQQFTDADSGKSVWGFPHVDATGKQISPADTFQLMIQRISSSDPELRMPKKRTMDAGQREDLFLWLQEQFAASP